MEKITLNKAPVRTSNNYGINDITLELEIPMIKQFQNITMMCYDFDDVKVENINLNEIKTDKVSSMINLKGEYSSKSNSKEHNLDEINPNEVNSNEVNSNEVNPNEVNSSEINSSEINSGEMSSRIGLNLQQNYGIKITIPKNTIVKSPIVLEFSFDEDNKTLVDNIKIKYEENSEATFIIKYVSESEDEQFHYLKNEVQMEKNSRGNILIANMLNDNSNSFIAYENNLQENAKLSSINIELGAKYKISNYYTRLEGDRAENDVKNIYIGTNNDVIDINYNIDTIGKNTKCTILSEGAVDGKAKKHFKGTIDFKEGSKKSKGIENENCMILSDEAESKSLPMLLCHEEDVYGEHGVSSGKPSESKLFYIMTKGISYNQARMLMVKAGLNKIIREIKDEDLKEEVTKMIERKLS